MYSIVCCRPDLTYTMSVIIWQAQEKLIGMQVNGSTARSIKFQKSDSMGDALVGYVDADFVANLDSRKSLIVYILTLFDSVVSWKPSHQPLVALSTTEAEFIALT